VAATEVTAVDGTTLVIRFVDENPVHAEGLERQREVLMQLVGRYVSEPIRIKLAEPSAGGGGGGGAAAARTRPARLTEDGARADRLARLRAEDPRLDATVEALDLELLE
jgi:hypothetical protein